MAWYKNSDTHKINVYGKSSESLWVAWFSSVWLWSYMFNSVVALLYVKGVVPKWTLPFPNTQTKIKRDKVLFPICCSSFVPARSLFRFVPLWALRINSFKRWKSCLCPAFIGSSFISNAHSYFTTTSESQWVVRTV